MRWYHIGMADAPHTSSSTNTCDIWNLPEANVLLIVCISGSVGHKWAMVSRLMLWILLLSASDANCSDYSYELLLSHVALLRVQALIVILVTINRPPLGFSFPALDI